MKKKHWIDLSPSDKKALGAFIVKQSTEYTIEPELFIKFRRYDGANFILESNGFNDAWTLFHESFFNDASSYTGASLNCNPLRNKILSLKPGEAIALVIRED